MFLFLDEEIEMFGKDWKRHQHSTESQTAVQDKRALVSLPCSRYTASSYLLCMVSKVSYLSLSCQLWMQKRKLGSSGRAKQKLFVCL